MPTGLLTRSGATNRRSFPNASGSSFASSSWLGLYGYSRAATGAVEAPEPPPDPPANTTAPVVSGTPQNGQTLSVTDGVWDNDPTDFSYQWKRDGNNIAGAIANTYVLVGLDEGTDISCTVTATNTGGSTGATSNAVGPILPLAPVNTVSPVVSGTPQVPNVLSVSPGTWSNGVSSFTYQWQHNGIDIGGATNNTYTLTTAEIGDDIRCVVTATNSGGSNSANSNTIGPVLPAAPVNTVAPAVTGTIQVGQTLSTTNGTWSNSPTGFTYQWKRNGGNISGATANSYVLVTADIGAAITCTVTASNAGGSGQATSNSVGPITDAAPVNTAAPVVSGTTQVGQTLSVTNGTWNNNPTGFSRQWRRGGVNISGATSATYVLVAADVGANIDCVVTATNTGGSTPQASNAVGPVIDLAPVNTTAPVVSGTTQVGQTLSTTNGVWNNTPTGYTYQWLRGGANITSATSSTYVLVTADIGANISCRVTATNSGGSTNHTSNAVGPIVNIPPSNTVAPVISGTIQVGNTLSTTNGTWTNSPTGFSYQWRRDGSNISGATSSSYLLVTADAGTNIVCRVTASNSGGSASSDSNSLGPILPAAPTNATLPTVSGTPLVGETLSTTNGTWTGSPSGFTYQWTADNVDISGATSSTFVLTTSQVGKAIRCKVVASNAGGNSSPATSSNSIGPIVAFGTPSRLGTPATRQGSSPYDHAATNIPANGTLYVVCLKRKTSTITGQSAISGGSLTYTPISEATYDDGSGVRLAMRTFAVVISSAINDLVITHAINETSCRAMIALYFVPGQISLPSANVGVGGNSNGDPQVDLPFAPDATSMLLGFCENSAASTAVTINAPSGMSVIPEGDYWDSTAQMQLQCAYKIGSGAQSNAWNSASNTNSVATVMENTV